MKIFDISTPLAYRDSLSFDERILLPREIENMLERFIKQIIDTFSALTSAATRIKGVRSRDTARSLRRLTTGGTRVSF